MATRTDGNNMGRMIREARKANDLTQAELSEKLHVSKQVISNWERGYTVSIDTQTLKRLSSILSLSLDELLETKKPGQEESAQNYSVFEGSLDFSRKLTALVTERGLTTETLYELTGIDSITSFGLLNGGRIPTIEQLMKICYALDESADWLLDLSTRRKLTAEQAFWLDTMSAKEKRLLDVFRGISEDDQDILIGKALEMKKENEKWGTKSRLQSTGTEGK